jgi:hypothetical protein
LRLLTLVLFGCCWLAPYSFCQDIRVRAIDAKTGEAIKGKTIRVQLTNPPDNSGRLGFSRRDVFLDEKTDSTGTAVFHLPNPPFATVVVGTGGHWVQCSPINYKVEDVLRSGSVVENQCLKLPNIAQRFLPAKPGEIVIFLKHWSLLNPEVQWPM